MCNPRKVMVHLTEAIEEAWRTTIEQTATAEDEIQELAQITADIPLDAEMGDMALQVMERLMRGEFDDYAAWDEDEEGNFRRDLGEVTLIYTPGTRQLIVEARLTELITIEARATAEASGLTIGEVAAEAVGRYYDDGWGGRTEEHARRDAQTEAERRMAAATEALHREQHAGEIATAETAAQAEADARAAEQLAQIREDTRDALRQRLQVVMAEAEDRIYHTMNRLVGEAYRHSLIEMALENGGRVVSDERSGSVINLELELY